MEHLDHPSHPPFQWFQNGAFLLIRAFVIGLGGGGGGSSLFLFIVSMIVAIVLYSVRVSVSQRYTPTQRFTEYPPPGSLNRLSLAQNPWAQNDISIYSTDVSAVKDTSKKS